MPRGRKYPIRALEVGQSVLIPWDEDASGAKTKYQDRIHAAVRQEQIKFGKVFERRREISGLRVRRVM